jgi:hypothetical protein
VPKRLKPACGGDADAGLPDAGGGDADGGPGDAGSEGDAGHLGDAGTLDAGEGAADAGVGAVDAGSGHDASVCTDGHCAGDGGSIEGPGARSGLLGGGACAVQVGNGRRSAPSWWLAFLFSAALWRSRRRRPGRR